MRRKLPAKQSKPNGSIEPSIGNAALKPEELRARDEFFAEPSKPRTMTSFAKRMQSSGY